jgi:hypothetical protein
MSLSTNLKIIGRLPKNSKIFGLHQVKNERLRNISERIVKKAIHKHCSDELAEEAIHGYRRPEFNDAISEENFMNTNQPYHPVKRDFHYNRALRTVEKLFRPSKRLKPISFPDLRYFPWTLNVSAELPYSGSTVWKKRLIQKQAEGEISDSRPTFHNLYDEIFHINRKHVHAIKYGMSPFWDDSGGPKPYAWTTLHSRVHLTKIDKPDKIRPVFGVPKLLLMVENMFIWNLQKEYLNENVKSPMLWGFETFRGGWNKLYNRLSQTRFNSVISADWSEFDHRALHEVIDDIHTMWRSWFDFDQGYEPSKSDTHDYSETKTEAWKIQNLWDWMTNAIKHTPILGPSGTIYQWQFNAIASGFQQTQLLDSFVNAVYLLTCLSAQGINIESEDFAIYVQGDDSLSVFPELTMKMDKSDFLSELAHEAKTRFNAILSVDKTTGGDTLSDVEVLSYKNRNGISYRNPAEVLAKLLYPERARTLAATASAALGLAVSTMGSSLQAYNVGKDVFDFITKEMGIIPSRDPNSKSYVATHQSVMTEAEFTFTMKNFPTYNEIFSLNFFYEGRADKDKQRLWPTKPTGNGFRFLLH